MVETLVSRGDKSAGGGGGQLFGHAGVEIREPDSPKPDPDAR